MDAALLDGVLRHGVRGSPALCPTVPGYPEEQQQRGLLHKSLPGAAHSQHPAHFFLVRKREKSLCFHLIWVFICLFSPLKGTGHLQGHSSDLSWCQKLME